MEKIDYHLKNWDKGNFLPLKKDGKIYYGGYQGWLGLLGISNFYIDRSCAVTALTNYIAYEKLASKKTSLSLEDYNRLQEKIYRYLRPRPWGVISIGLVDRAMKKFARENKLDLRAKIKSGDFTRANVLNYIREGLEANKPILILTWNSPIKDLSYHWVTLTRLYEEENKLKMVVSTWGEQRIYSFDEWFDGPSLYKGLIYWE